MMINIVHPTQELIMREEMKMMIIKEVLIIITRKNLRFHLFPKYLKIKKN